MARYGAQGIVFLVPGRVPSRPGPLPPTWEDVRGRPEEKGVLERDSGDDAFLSWEEIADLQRAGVFEFQSHTLSHSLIHTGPEVVGFMSPGLGRGVTALDVPLVREDGKDLFPGEIPLGTPLLRSQPRTSEALRFFEEGAFREACRKAAQDPEFFRGRDWEETLRSRLAGTVFGRFETPGERAAAMRVELEDSRRAIEAHTGAPAQHLCYPWHAWGPTARRVAEEVGYKTAFCGMVPGVTITPPSGDPMRIARVGEDWVETLPGKGRLGLHAILGRKWFRRLKAG
jgi:hypothetical protein